MITFAVSCISYIYVPVCQNGNTLKSQLMEDSNLNGI